MIDKCGYYDQFNDEQLRDVLLRCYTYSQRNACHGMEQFAVCCKQKNGVARPGRKTARIKPPSPSSVKVGYIRASRHSGQVVW